MGRCTRTIARQLHAGSQGRSIEDPVKAQVVSESMFEKRLCLIVNARAATFTRASDIDHPNVVVGDPS